MARALTSLAMIATILLGGLLSAPDVHADESFAGIHVVDHLAAHGSEHYTEVDHTGDADGDPHLDLHHHNCSFDTPSFSGFRDMTKSAHALPVPPLSDQALSSREQGVLKEPPKA